MKLFSVYSIIKIGIKKELFLGQSC